MIHRTPLLAAAVLLMGFQQARAPADAPRRSVSSDVIVSPEWEIAPSLTYPSLADSHDVFSGQVVLNSELTAARRLKHCRVVSEDPKGEGFGEAALAGVSLGMISESWASRYEVGQSISLPVHFRLD
jgi:hypothetical protein